MTPAHGREAWITGTGLVSALGEGLDAHWQALHGDRDAWLKLNTETFAPFQVHPAAAINLDTQIPKRGDQRQMEPWQRLGTYAAGLALENAGIKGDAALLAATHMIVAAGGGERDYAVDGQILTGLAALGGDAPARGRFLNERLMSDLRPTLFLAQLSNLLAGNISIVHGVTGSSRTFMGEEAAGVDAVRIALARCHAGQGDVFLVGGAYAAERPDVILHYELGGYNWSAPWRPVFERDGAGGMVLGSLASFLVIEAREHAEARGARPIARLSAVSSDWTHRQNGAAAASLDRQIGALAPQLGPGALVVSGATGIAEVTAQEKAVLDKLDLPVRATGSVLGHALEAQFPANIALAAMMVAKGAAVPPIGGSPLEVQAAAVSKALVTSLGHFRGEGLGLVEAV